MAVPDPLQPSPPAGLVAWRPSEYLTPDEIDELQYHWNEIAKVRGILAAGGFRFEKKLWNFVHDSTIKAFQMEVGALQRKSKWAASAALVQYAIAQGFRSDHLYFVGAEALANEGFCGEARDLLLQGEDLLSGRTFYDYARFHYALACYECRLGNLEMAEERLKQANQLGHWVRAEALDEPDLEPLWRRIRLLPPRSLPEPISDDEILHPGPRPADMPSPEEVSRRMDEEWEKGMACAGDVGGGGNGGDSDALFNSGQLNPHAPMESPTEQTSLGELKPSPPVSITPQQEEESRVFWEEFDAGMARLREKAAEAERAGIPLHYLIPVN